MLDLEKVFGQMEKNLTDLLMDKDIKNFYLTSVKKDRLEINKLRKLIESQRAELTKVNSQLQHKVNKVNEVVLIMSNLASAYDNKLAGFFAKSISDFLQSPPDTALNLSDLYEWLTSESTESKRSRCKTSSRAFLKTLSTRSTSSPSDSRRNHSARKTPTLLKTERWI